MFRMSSSQRLLRIMQKEDAGLRAKVNIFKNTLECVNVE